MWRNENKDENKDEDEDEIKAIIIKTESGFAKLNEKIIKIK